MVDGDSINFNVQGVYFSLLVSDIELFPQSYFAHLLKDEWNPDREAVAQVDRDSGIFRLISYYIHFRDSFPMDYDLDVVMRIRREADFYNLPKLVRMCDDVIPTRLVIDCQALDYQQDDRFRRECVAESKSVTSDRLLASVLPFYPPAIATARLNTFAMDSFHYLDVRYILQKEHGKRMSDPTYHNCTVYAADSLVIQSQTLTRLRNSFQKWPLAASHTDFHEINQQIQLDLLCVYQPGGYRKNTGMICHSRMGVVLYIFNSTFTGGTVSATINGNTVSISKPGECMCLAAGVDYSVDTVTSGILTLIEFHNHKAIHAPALVSTLQWTLHTSPPRPCTTARTLQGALVEEIAHSLHDNDCVVLCLSHFYRISHSIDGGRRFETDPNGLKCEHAELYAALAAHFTVDVVCVSVYRTEQTSGCVHACVLDYLSATTNGATIEPAIPATSMKIVAPVFGYGLSFQFTGASEHGRGCALTGLMISSKL